MHTLLGDIYCTHSQGIGVVAPVISVNRRLSHPSNAGSNAVARCNNCLSIGRHSTIVCLGRTGHGACAGALAASGSSEEGVQLEFRAADLAAAADLEDATTSSMQVRL